MMKIMLLRDRPRYTGTKMHSQDIPYSRRIPRKKRNQDQPREMIYPTNWMRLAEALRSFLIFYYMDPNQKAWKLSVEKQNQPNHSCTLRFELQIFHDITFYILIVEQKWCSREKQR